MVCVLLRAYEMPYWAVWIVFVGCCTREQWWALVFSPKRACLAQARSTEARPSYFTRAVAQATHAIFERANVSLRREGSCLSEITRKVTVPLFELSPRQKGLAWARVSHLSETLQPEQGVGRGQCDVWLFLCSWLVGTCLDNNCYVKNMIWMILHEWWDSWIVNDELG